MLEQHLERQVIIRHLRKRAGLLELGRRIVEVDLELVLGAVRALARRTLVMMHGPQLLYHPMRFGARARLAEPLERVDGDDDRPLLPALERPLEEELRGRAALPVRPIDEQP